MDFDEFLDDRHPWLTEIAAEVRSLLREYGNERVHEHLRQWSEAVDAVHNEMEQFEARREAHFETHVLADARLRDVDAGAPAIGWNWGFERVGPDAAFKPTYGWAPPELCPTRRPEVELPIPLPHDRNLTLPEQYAALSAIYDCCWKGGKVSPWPAPSEDAEFAEFIAKLKAGTHYSALLKRVPDIPATDELFFRDNLLDVKDDWKNSAQPANEAEEDTGKGKRRKASKKRGRTPDTDPARDKRIHDEWKKSGYGTYAEFATKNGYREADVREAVDRHRKRRKK